MANQHCKHCGAPDAPDLYYDSDCYFDGERTRFCYKRENAQLLSLLSQAELAIAFANREPNVIRMLGDDYTEVLQLIRAALKETNP